MTEHDTEEGKKALRASMRRTLLLMESMGVPKHVLLDVLEASAKELREELQREGVH